MSIENKVAKQELKQYYPDECMFTGLKAKVLEYHHIDKKEDGGPATKENGALSIDCIHRWLHCIIEFEDPDLFDLANECLLLYKAVMDCNNLELIKMYRDEVMPLYREKYYDYRAGRIKRKTYNNNEL